MLELCKENVLKAGNEGVSTKTRRILFVIGCMILFMLWGQKVYANSINVQKGEELEFTVSFSCTELPHYVVKDSSGNSTTTITPNGNVSGCYRTDSLKL